MIALFATICYWSKIMLPTRDEDGYPISGYDVVP